jgi:Flp pilus assembly protein TadB
MSELPGGLPPQQRTAPQDEQRVSHVEVSTPLWRVVAVMCAAAAIAAIAYWLNAIHHADDFATVAVITTAYTITFWARRRPDRVEQRFGPFGRIARAIRDSQDDLRRWVYDQPLRAGVLIAVGYGIAVVIGKHIVITVVHAFWSPWLAVAAGAAIGAAVAAPRMFTSLGRRIAGKPR